MQRPFRLVMHMAGESLNPTLTDLIVGFLADARRDQKFRKRIYNEVLCCVVTLFAKLIPRPDEIVHVDERPFSQFIHGFREPQGIPPRWEERRVGKEGR